MSALAPIVAPAFDERPGKLGLTLDGSTRVVDIREHTAWSAEDLVLPLNTVVEADIVLNLTAVADPYGRADHHILADGAIFANLALLRMCTKCQIRVIADFARLVDIGAFVDCTPGNRSACGDIVDPTFRCSLGWCRKDQNPVNT
jgi:hypothetical protein